MNSKHLKSHGVEWLRFTKRCEVVTTECGCWNADVVGVTDKELIELETKISVGDLRAEASKRKHIYYKTCELWTPNRFYFLVPENLEQQAIDQTAKMNSHYGVMLCTEYGIRVVKRAKNIHTRAPSDRIKSEALLRMGSELCVFHKRNRIQSEKLEVS